MSVVAFAVWNDLFWSAVVMFATFCNYNQQPSLDYPSSSSPITKTPSLHGSVTQSFLVNTVRYHQSSIANLIFSCYFFISSNLIYQKNLQSVNDQQITMSQSPDLQPLMQDILPSTKTDSQQLHPKGSNAPTGEDEHCWWFVRNPVIKLTSWGTWKVEIPTFTGFGIHPQVATAAGFLKHHQYHKWMSEMSVFSKKIIA